MSDTVSLIYTEGGKKPSEVLREMLNIAAKREKANPSLPLGPQFTVTRRCPDCNSIGTVARGRRTGVLMAVHLGCGRETVRAYDETETAEHVRMRWNASLPYR